jgi:hypothetical protein
VVYILLIVRGVSACGLYGSICFDCLFNSQVACLVDMLV